MDLKEIGINMRNWTNLPRIKDYWRVLVNAMELVITLIPAVLWHANR